jgi:CHAT domain-containing protein
MSRDVLTVRMISSTRVAAELVVLSACASGLGVASASDFLGLGRAWLAAGARGTVTALWNIENSATQALMLDFYRRLSDDNGGFRNAAQALRGAQRDAAKRSSFYQWAAFRYTGWPLLHLPEGTHT